MTGKGNAIDAFMALKSEFISAAQPARQAHHDDEMHDYVTARYTRAATSVFNVLRRAGIGDDEIGIWLTEGSDITVRDVITSVLFSAENKAWGTLSKEGWAGVEEVIRERQRDVSNSFVDSSDHVRLVIRSLCVYPVSVDAIEWESLAIAIEAYTPEGVSTLVWSGWSLTRISEQVERGIDLELLAEMTRDVGYAL